MHELTGRPRQILGQERHEAESPHELVPLGHTFTSRPAHPHHGFLLLRLHVPGHADSERKPRRSDQCPLSGMPTFSALPPSRGRSRRLYSSQIVEPPAPHRVLEQFPHGGGPGEFGGRVRGPGSCDSGSVSIATDADSTVADCPTRLRLGVPVTHGRLCGLGRGDGERWQ